MKQENLTSCFMNVDFCYAKTANVSVSMHLYAGQCSNAAA